MKDNNAYLKQGKWKADRVYKILTNSIYIGIFEYGKYKRKPQDILRVEDYCEPIIDLTTWNTTTWILGNVTRIPRHELPQTLDFSDFLPLFT